MQLLAPGGRLQLLDATSVVMKTKQLLMASSMLKSI
jgi:hypothetical protein